MSNQNGRVKCIQVSERELEGVQQRAEFAQQLLGEIAQEAWKTSKTEDDAMGKLAKLTRQQAQELQKLLGEVDYELKYGKRRDF